MFATVIADIVGSRAQPDRNLLQRGIEAAIDRVEAVHPAAERPLRATVADEFQGVYPSVHDALTATLLVRFALPDGVGCRFGIGWGEVRPVTSVAGDIEDGSGWWAAREAVERAHALEDGRVAPARTWFVAHESTEADVQRTVPLVNAYLLARDQVVAAMSDRTRRLAFGAWQRVPQVRLAGLEGISQSAVSQALSKAGVPALLTGLEELGAGAVRPSAGVAGAR